MSPLLRTSVAFPFVVISVTIGEVTRCVPQDSAFQLPVVWTSAAKARVRAERTGYSESIYARFNEKKWSEVERFCRRLSCTFEFIGHSHNSAVAVTPNWIFDIDPIMLRMASSGLFWDINNSEDGLGGARHSFTTSRRLLFADPNSPNREEMRSAFNRAFKNFLAEQRQGAEFIMRPTTSRENCYLLYVSNLRGLVKKNSKSWEKLEISIYISPGLFGEEDVGVDVHVDGSYAFGVFGPQEKKYKRFDDDGMTLLPVTLAICDSLERFLQRDRNR